MELDEEIVCACDELSTATEHADISLESDEPSVEEALKGPNAKHWQHAMDEEVAAIEKNGTWELVDPPIGTNIIWSHFILKVKCDEKGEITHYKAQLVANSNMQREGIDFNETFAAVAKLPSVCAVLTNATSQGWEIHQINIKNAYLNTELSETIYMHPPSGCLKPGQEGKVCKLIKCLYSTQQASFEWYETLHEFFTEIGFMCSVVNHVVFFRHEGEFSSVVSVSTDDMVITGNSIDSINWVKGEFRKRFEISDLGEIKWLLGLEIKYDKAARTLSISQGAYIDKLIEHFGLSDANAISTPFELGTALSADQSPSMPCQTAEMLHIPYKELVGSIAWSALTTHPDISFPSLTLAQFMQNPGCTHWEVGKRIIHYLKGMRNYALNLTDPNKGIIAYVDADWGLQNHCHSISGHIVSFAGMLVAWGSKKQSIVALSSTEAEYVAMTNVLKDILWLRNLIAEIHVPITTPTPLHCDNQGAIALTLNNKFHLQMKHIDIRYHFIQEAVENDHVLPLYCPTDAMVMDVLTKVLPHSKLLRFIEMLGLY